MIYKRFCLLFIAFAFAACENPVAEIAMPKIEAEPVMVAYLSPESRSIFVMISHTQPTQSQGNEELIKPDEARVYISDGTIEIEIPILSPDEEDEFNHWQESRNATPHRFFAIDQADFPIQDALTYTLRAEYPNGRQMTASTTIFPKEILEVNFSNLEVEDRHDETQNYDMEVRYTIQWESPANRPEGFTIGYHFYRRSITFNDQTDNWEPIGEDYPQEFGYWDIIDNRDKQSTSFSNTGRTTFDRRFTSKLNVALAHLNEDIIRYENSYNYSGFDPFTEPSVVFTNVENGRGLVGSYRLYELTAYEE
ncbi:MAG: DUF4249 domain-containing protein [Cyclobacteriaceae bacterium]|nr:DUF4249 family protein [Cyclobacteriaceae bacterium]MCH8516835.1 DUF4249 domain-containing protein [Cyclobacteriaceae bacterium]